MSTTAPSASSRDGNERFGEALAFVLGLTDEAYQAMRDGLEDCAGVSSRGDVARIIESATAVSLREARNFLDTTAALVIAILETPSPSRRNYDATLKVTTDLADGLLSNESAERRASAAERLAQVLTSNAVRLAGKATRLQFHHENLYKRGDVVSDLRPVFTGEGEDDPSAFLIWHTLRIQTTSGAPGLDNSMLVEFALDGQDLEALNAEITRAIDKHNALKAKLSASGVTHYAIGDLKGKTDD